MVSIHSGSMKEWLRYALDTEKLLADLGPGVLGAGPFLKTYKDRP